MLLHLPQHANRLPQHFRHRGTAVTSKNPRSKRTIAPFADGCAEVRPVCEGSDSGSLIHSLIRQSVPAPYKVGEGALRNRAPGRKPERLRIGPGVPVRVGCWTFAGSSSALRVEGPSGSGRRGKSQRAAGRRLAAVPSTRWSAPGPSQGATHPTVAPVAQRFGSGRPAAASIAAAARRERRGAGLGRRRGLATDPSSRRRLQARAGRQRTPALNPDPPAPHASHRTGDPPASIAGGTP